MKAGKFFSRVAWSALLAACVVAVLGTAPARASASSAPFSDGTYVMADVNSGMCLSLTGTGLGDWTEQQPCTDTWELWYFHNVGGQNYTIGSTAANQCLAWAAETRRRAGGDACPWWRPRTGRAEYSGHGR